MRRVAGLFAGLCGEIERGMGSGGIRILVGSDVG